MNIDRDRDTVMKIVRYCDEIDESLDLFERNYEALQEQSTFRNSVAMCLLQTGELTTHLSPAFKARFPGMPWQDMKGMRNIAAHHYGNIDLEILWDTVMIDIPALRKYCLDICLK